MLSSYDSWGEVGQHFKYRPHLYRNKHVRQTFPDEQICAGGEEAKDACQVISIFLTGSK